MNTPTPLIAAALLAASLVSGAAHATLLGRDLNGSIDGFEAYYDTDLNVTWLADANYAQTSGYDADGRMTWSQATTWAANLSFTNGVNVYDNWRLPTTLQPDASCGSQSGGGSYGYNCTGSEMGHLFYSELSGTAGQPILTSGDPDLAKITNLQANYYWSATEYAPNTGNATAFNLTSGHQGTGYKYFGLYALAVSPGDVAAVPEPSTYSMMLAGLGLLGFMARRRKTAKV